MYGEKTSKKEFVALLSVLVNVVLSIAKILVGLAAHSSAILADGLHSGMDVVSSIISFVGIKIAKKPSDEKHPYGHHKFEVLSGLIITLILLATGVGIMYEAFKSFKSASIVSVSYLSLGVMLFSAIVNEAMARLKIFYGKKENSISLISDGVHSRIDVYTSIAVLLGVALTKVWVYFDAALAMLIGVYIVKESFTLGKEATDSLLDVSAGKEVEQKIIEIAKNKNIEVSDLKTQKRGSAITANIEIKLPKNLNLDQATRIANDLKNELMKNIQNLEYVAIQITSHDFETDSFQALGITKQLLPGLTPSFSWTRRGLRMGRVKGFRSLRHGRGPAEFCVCPNCGFKIKHEPGVPCSQIHCPKCNSLMRRL